MSQDQADDAGSRLLHLLGLLQSRADWPGPALAMRLGVSTRTVRKDIERLRELGYPVHANPGIGGGTGSARGRGYLRWSSMTTRPSRSQSGCAPPQAARSAESRRPRCAHWPSWSKCYPHGCGRGSPP